MDDFFCVFVVVVVVLLMSMSPICWGSVTVRKGNDHRLSFTPHLSPVYFSLPRQHKVSKTNEFGNTRFLRDLRTRWTPSPSTMPDDKNVNGSPVGRPRRPLPGCRGSCNRSLFAQAIGTQGLL